RPPALPRPDRPALAVSARPATAPVTSGPRASNGGNRRAHVLIHALHPAQVPKNKGLNMTDPASPDTVLPAASPDAAEDKDAPSLLVQEGDIAADYLERLLDIVDYDGDIDLDVENGRAMVAIVGSDL